MAEKQQSKTAKGCLVLVALVTFLMLIGVFSDGDRPANKNAATPARKDYPKRGDIVTPNPGYLRACMNTKEGLSELIRWQNAGDAQEMALTMARMGGQVFEATDQLKVLDPVAGFGVSKIRVVSTERECYCLIELVKH